MKKLMFMTLVVTLIMAMTLSSVAAFVPPGQIKRMQAENQEGKIKAIPPGLIDKGGLPPGLHGREVLPPGIVMRFIDAIPQKETLTGEDALVYVQPENFNTHDGDDYKGINVGFNLGQLSLDDMDHVTVSLYSDDRYLVSNTATEMLWQLEEGTTQFSTPFIIVEGTYTEAYWDLGSFAWTLLDKPTKAVITIVDKEGVTYIVEREGLSEDTASFSNFFSTQNYLGEAAYEYVVPDNFNTHSGNDYKGLNVGFRLESLNISDLSAVMVSLYQDETLLVTNTAKDTLWDLSDDVKQLSTPFIITPGTYVEDYWVLGECTWTADAKPTRAEIIIFDNEGNVYFISNSSLSESTADFVDLFE